MYRRDTWKEGFYQDNLVKYKCYDCEKHFIVGKELAKDCPPGFPVCPYCGQSNVEVESETEDDLLEEMDLGCIGIYVDFEE